MNESCIPGAAVTWRRFKENERAATGAARRCGGGKHSCAEVERWKVRVHKAAAVAAAAVVAEAAAAAALALVLSQTLTEAVETALHCTLL